MSADRTSERAGKLIADVGIGVAVHVANGHFETVGSGADRLELDVKPGIYSIEWTSPDINGETMVRVRSGETITVRPPEAEDRRRADPAIAAIAAFPVIEQYLGSTGRLDRADLVVTVDAPADALVKELIKSIRLIDGSDREVDLHDNLAPGHKIPMLAWPAVTAGRYRLRYRGTSGEALDQTIPVLRDRRTIVRLFATHVTLLVPDGERLSSTRSFGIDPSRTLIWTALPHDSADGIHEQMRLAQILLRDLASGTGSLSAGFIDYLSAPRCDPILKLYAAMVVYNCLEREVSPAPETHYPGGEANDSLSGFRKSWLGFSDEMLEGATRGGMPPDLTVGLWQAERLNSRLRPKKKVAAYIQMPTMLECAWRWAIARTTKDRLALQGFASIRAAARTAGGTTPWLCWQASAAKAINQTSKVPTGQKLDELIHKVAGKTREIRLRNESVGRNFTLPGFVPAEAAIAALRAEAIIEDQDRSREAFVSPAASLAMALALPEAALGARLQRTLELLDEAIADMLPQASPEAANARRDVPGWIARIRHKDDPNKERFGGRSKASGFELVARFKLTESSNFAWIFLEIDGPIADGETAIFYLHDSFRPARREAEFKNGRAKLKVASWGGFTVGAWVPRLQTMLELDLAQVKDAPRIIKDR